MEKSVGGDFISAEAKTPSPSDKRATITSPLYTILRPEAEDDGNNSDGNKKSMEAKQNQSLDNPNEPDESNSRLPRRRRRKVKRYEIDYSVYGDDEDWFAEPQRSPGKKKSRYMDEDQKNTENSRTDSRRNPKTMILSDTPKKEKQKPSLKMASIDSMFPTIDAKLNSKTLLDLLKKPIPVQTHDDARIRDSAVRMYISHVVKGRQDDIDSSPVSEVAFFI